MVNCRRQAVIIKTGTKLASLSQVAGDYEDWIAAGIRVLFPTVTVIDVARGEALPPIEKVAMIAITGSGAMVTDRTPWMERSAVWLRKAVNAEVPILGICFGHQLLAHALGGEVGYNTRGVEVGTVNIRLTPEAGKDALFSDMPQEFAAQVTHRQSVLRLPRGATLLATSDKDPHQAFSYGCCTWGVQFHPEFDAVIIGHYIDDYRKILEQEGESADKLLAEIRESPDSAGLLARFAVRAKACSEEQ